MTYNCQVAVVGGGIAGLAAADHLIQRNIPTNIFEQSNRIGGRIWSPRSPSGQHREEGAFTFSDVESTINHYVERFGLEKIEQTRVDKRFKFKEIKGTFSQNGEFLEGDEKKIPLASLLSHYLNKIEASSQSTDCSIYEALKNVGASEKAIAWLGKNTLLGLIGNDMQEVSANSVKVYLDQYTNSTKFYALRGGNDSLCDALAKQFPQAIHYDFNVSKVVIENKKIILSSSDKIAVSESAVFALPLTALGQIEFIPELPADKKNAISTIGYTSCSRLTVEGPSDLLGEAAGGVFAITDQPAGWFRNQTLFQNKSGNAIFNWSAVGATSKEMNQKDPDVAFAEIMNGLDDFITLPRENLTFNFFSWDHISWIRGGYSYFPPKTFHLQNVLKRPEGPIYFAGEHTSSKYASMNGALESGIRAAEEILSRSYQQIL